MGAHHHHVGELWDERDCFPASGAVMRPSLAAGLAFLEMTAGDVVRVADLAAWVHEHLAEPGIIPMPATVHEPDVGSVSLAPQPSPAWAASIDARGARILEVTIARVTAALRGLIALPVDDRFLSANIFAGRVQRVTTDRGAGWQPVLRGNERLSDMVLALFAADVLEHREDYEKHLRVCDECGRICFGPASSHCPR